MSVTPLPRRQLQLSRAVAAIRAMPLWPALRLDFRLQRRYGFYYATLFALVIWIGVLQVIPDRLLGPAMPYLLFGDLQFFFVFMAGALFFEKGEHTLSVLVTTPLRFGEYLAAKVVSMSTLALVTCTVIVLADYGLGFDPPALVAGTVLTTLMMMLAGFISAPIFPSVSEWLMPSTLVLLVLNTAALQYSGAVTHPLFYLVPTLAPYLWLGAAFHQVELSGWQLAYAIGYPVLWTVLLCVLARVVFVRYVLGKEGSA